MIASKVTRETLERAANSVGVALEMTTLNCAGTRHRVKVNPVVPEEAWQNREKGRKFKDERGDSRYQRLSASAFRSGRVAAVCWHGFRDFFRAVYKTTPEARFVTAMDTWKNSEDFEARFRESGHKNIGSAHRPVMAAEACRCGEEGIAS